MYLVLMLILESSDEVSLVIFEDADVAIGKDIKKGAYLFQGNKCNFQFTLFL